MSKDKYEFCSDKWVGVARNYIESVAAKADLSGIDTSFAEVFTDAPAHLGVDDQGRTGWYVVVKGGKVEVGKGVKTDASTQITADYATVLPLARAVFEGNPQGAAKAQEAVQKAVAAGKMKMPAPDPNAPELPWSGKLHDVLAARTL